MGRSRKRVAVVVVPLVALVGVGVAFANTLGISSTTLGGGSGTVDNACALSASYAPSDLTFAATPTPGYYVTKVTVTPSGASCDGKSWKVSLTDSSNAQLAEMTGTFAATAAAMTSTLASGGALAHDVTGITAVVTG